MKSVLLETPAGIVAHLGWDPQLDPDRRIRALATELVAGHEGVDPKRVHVDYEAPAQFGHRVQMEATVDADPQPLTIKAASFRGASVVAIADAAVPIGLDIRDLVPDESTQKEMRRHSHLWPETTSTGLLAHWTRVQAVLAADGRGARVHPEHVRLDTPLNKGWIPDRRVYYRIADLSRDGFVITLAYGALPA